MTMRMRYSITPTPHRQTATAGSWSRSAADGATGARAASTMDSD
jgi:hypothetical protein